MELRPGLPPLPDRIKNLPISPKGYPTPWFVITMPDGTRDFRIADQVKRVRAVKERLCWLCGEKVGIHVSFVIGPMCAVNRNTSEPGCHRECAVFAATACPFLTLPKAQYREANLPKEKSMPVHAIPGNPGACCIWTTKTFKPYRAGPDPIDWLIRLGEPTSVLWYCEGKPATREQIQKSLDERIHFLEEAAAQDGPEGKAALAQYVDRAMKYLPA